MVVVVHLIVVSIYIFIFSLKDVFFNFSTLFFYSVIVDVLFVFSAMLSSLQNLGSQASDQGLISYGGSAKSKLLD